MRVNVCFMDVEFWEKLKQKKNVRISIEIRVFEIRYEQKVFNDSIR